MAKPSADAEAAAIEDGEGEGRQKRSTPIKVAGLPAGVRAIFRLKPWREAENFTTYIYGLVANPQKPGKVDTKFKRKLFNTEVEESWLQENFPAGGRFRVMYQVPHPDEPGDVQLFSDDFDIDRLETAPALVAPGVVAAPAVAPAAAGDPLAQLNGSLATLEALARIAGTLAGNQAQPAAAPATTFYEKLMQEKLKTISEYEDKLMKKLHGEVPKLTNGAAPAPAAAWPEFLQPFVPKIKEFGIQTLQDLAGKLMGGGLENAGLRYLVLNNKAFREVWGDLNRRNAAAQALVEHLGEAGENLIRLFATEMDKAGPGPGAQQ